MLRGVRPILQIYGYFVQKKTKTNLDALQLCYIHVQLLTLTGLRAASQPEFLFP